MAGEIAKLFVAIGAKTTDFHRGIDGVENRMNQVSKRMRVAGAAMVGAVTAVGVGSLKLAADFDSAMREVNTMMLLSEDAFKDFSAEVQALAKEMGVNAVEAANALYQAISAGVPKENAIDFLRIATKAAIGGVTDTKTAVDGLTTVLNAFRIPVTDAEKVADIMFTTVKGGKTTFEELSASLFNVAPIAASLGIEFETVAAALATMTKQGVPTAQATTQLRQAMVALTKPTTEMQAAIDQLGYASGQAMLQELGFAETINRLTEAAAGNNEQLMRMFGSVEAGSAILALTGDNAQMFATDIAAMGNSAGAAEDAFNQMEKTTARQFAKLKQSLQDIGITIGKALMPALQKVIDAIAPILKKLGDWIQKHPKLTAAILATVGALGAMLLIMPQLAAATKILTAMQWALNAAMAANPIGLVVLAIAGLIAAIVALERKFGLLTATTKTELEEQTRIWQVEIDKQRGISRSAFEEEMGQISALYQARIAILSEEKKAALEPYLTELAMIDKWMAGTDEVIEKEANLDEVRDAMRQSQAAKTASEVEAAEKKINDLREKYGEAGLRSIMYQIQAELRAVEQGYDAQIAVEKTAGEDELAILRQRAEAYDELINKVNELVNTYKIAETARIEEEEKPRLTPWGPSVGMPKWLSRLLPMIYTPPKAGLAEEPTEITEALQALQDMGDKLPTEEQMAKLTAAIESLQQYLKTIAETTSTTSIPELQHGGIVRKPTLALLHSNEAVIPLNSSLGGLGGHGGNVVININAGALMGNESEARSFARLIHKYLREETRTRAVGITV